MTSLTGPRVLTRPPAIPSAHLWLTVAVPVAAVAWGANQFIPMLIVYSGALALPDATVQAVFGLYAAGLVAGLLAGGPASDRFGRRRLLVLALVLSGAGSSLLLVGGRGSGWLFAGRLVGGLASGTAFSTGAAWLRELSVPASPGEPNPGPRRATTAMGAGFTGGPLAAGLLAECAPAPTVVPYLPHLVLVLVGLALTTRAPRGAARRPGGLATSAPAAGPGAPPGGSAEEAIPRPGSGRFLLVVVPIALWVFTTATVAMAYLPVLVQGGGHSTPLGAAATGGVTAAAGIAVQPLVRRSGRPDTMPALSLGLTTGGFAMAATVAATGSLALLLLAAVLLGGAYGVLQVWGLAEVQQLAPAERLAGVTALYQAVTYLGFAAPYLLTLAGGVVPPVALMLVLAAAASVCGLWLRIATR